MKYIIRFKTGLLAAAVALCASFFTGCGNSGDSSTDESGNKNKDRYSIVCTTFPQYDWVRQIIGDDSPFDVTLLLKKGEDMHSYQPTVDDMYKIAVADVFVYVGGTSDQWVADALKNVKNTDIKTVNMMEVLGDSIKAEETIEGMQSDEHDHSDSDHADTGHNDSQEDTEYDEHVWLSLKNAAVISQALCNNLKDIDSSHAGTYEANTAAYIAKLNELDNEYSAAVTGSAKKAVIFADRFPFRYLTDDYGLTYYAAFPGCSAETEASFETVTFLAGKVDELGLSAIYTIENSDGRIASTVKNNTKTKNQEILTLNSMQSVSEKDIAAGANYIDIMKDNLSTLKKGLQ